MHATNSPITWSRLFVFAVIWLVDDKTHIIMMVDDKRQNMFVGGFFDWLCLHRDDGLL